MVVCLVQGADLHMAQRVLLPLTVSCSSKIQIGFTFLVPAHLGSPGKGPLNGCACVRACVITLFRKNVYLFKTQSEAMYVITGLVYEVEVTLRHLDKDQHR